ncbi:MAG: glutamate--tRNA ligase, partial [Clostridiales bacterium]|nr:glutamate--tRNA ligase [Candidatus Apopatousia equi]
MDYKKLADLLFPDVKLTKDDLEKMYPERNLEKGAIVTRFAPSPTGFLHIGSVFTCLVASNFANKTGGKFILRIEDTDQNRLIPGAVQLIIEGLSRYKINFDEGRTEDGNDFGDYGTYQQSLRKPIYMAMAKYLVSEGKAYPCFCDEDTTARDKMIQEANKELIGYYGQYAHCRNLTIEEVEENLKAGKKFCIRLKCESNADNKIIVEDAIRGTLRLSDNFKDVVLLKRDFLPPYNFAHACDDHFMRVNLVVRGDEYLPSIAEHLQIFKACGFEPIKYAHVAPIQKMEGDSKRKISKRKDPEANVAYYMEEGYPVESVREYLLTVANSNFEEWRKQNPDASNEDFVVSLNKMSISGALFDLPKLNDVSKNVISKFDAQKVYDLSLEWARLYDKDFAKLLEKNKDFALKVLSIERGTPKPRKDLAKWIDLKSTYFYFFDELFNPQKSDYPFDEKFDKNDIVCLLSSYKDLYNEDDDKQAWFDKVKHLGENIGFANDMKEFKASPESFKGHYGDISTFIRIALTTRTNTPDLYEIMKLLGKDKVVERLNRCIE